MANEAIARQVVQLRDAYVTQWRKLRGVYIGENVKLREEVDIGGMIIAAGTKTTFFRPPQKKGNPYIAIVFFENNREVKVKSDGSILLHDL